MSLKNAIGGVALIAGTAIGAAVLALPVATAHLGFTQTVVIFLCCWVFMTMGALYLLEANLFVGHGANLFTMAQTTFGEFGKYFTLAIYLILLYALTAAYLDGAGAWINQGLGALNPSLPPQYGYLVATALTIFVIILGTAFTDWVNRALMVGLLGAFATLLYATVPQIRPAMLLETPFHFDLRPVPMIITAFGSAIVIPTLTAYLHGNARQLLRVVLIGSIIPLLVYLVWEFAILGIIPVEGNPGLLMIKQQGHPVTDISEALHKLLGNPWLTTAASYFSLFALVTSLIGVSLSLFDFLADSLHLRKTLRGKLFLSVIAFLPPLAFVHFYPRGFSVALSFAGIFVAVLLGILPAMMAWQGRYRLKLARPLQIPGGKLAIAVTIAFFLFVIGIECFNQYEIVAGRLP